jgi:hypothetical protein
MKTALILLFVFSGFWKDQVVNHQEILIYRVHYYCNERKISSDEEISLTVTGNMWKKDTKQKEAIWNYHSEPETKILFRYQFSLGWLSSDTTGIVDNDKRIWVHPPRHNQYFLTETAPFPDFRKKSRVGDRYSSITFIGTGFGPWEGKKVKSNYSVECIEAGIEDSLWTIKAVSDVEGKINNCEFIFSDTRGFVSLSYAFYNGDSLTMKLEK